MKSKPKIKNTAAKNAKPCEPKRSMGKPHHDYYCRGCHARPSYHNINTYYCPACWERWNKLRRSAVPLDASEVLQFTDELRAFIKSRGRYVWHSEVYLYLRPVSMKELKKHGVKVTNICREFGYFAPGDDRFTRETVARVEEFVMEFQKKNDRLPSVREVLAGINIDHTTLWSCMDLDQYIAGLGGRDVSIFRYRFLDTEDFLNAAAEVVRKEGCAMAMTVILDEMGVSYPAYLANFDSVTAEQIHERAGISHSLDGVDSLNEVAARSALNQLGWKVEAGVSFSDLVGKNDRPMKFDLRLVDTDILVEIDGPQHYDSNNFMYKKNIVANDAIKNEFASRKGYRLIRVDTRINKSPRAMREFFHQHIGRGPHGPITPSNALNTANRRKPMGGSARRRPRKK